MWSGLLYATLMNAEVFIVILKEGMTVHSVLLLLIPWIMLVSGGMIWFGDILIVLFHAAVVLLQLLLYVYRYFAECDLFCAAAPSLLRSGLSTCLRLRLHRRHLRGGFPAGLCLLLLPSLPDDSGTDHQGVVLDPPALQPRAPGQPP